VHFPFLTWQSRQIIKEKLAFPSGTATAQLISVLHQQPLSKLDGITHRTNAYEALASEDPDSERQAHRTIIEDQEDSNQTDEEEGRELLIAKGWNNLLWSFAASGLLTASLQTAAYATNILTSIHS
jgi:uncharacterized oligopeptide transporter (OPT) family protein